MERPALISSSSSWSAKVSHSAMNLSRGWGTVIYVSKSIISQKPFDRTRPIKTSTNESPHIPLRHNAVRNLQQVLNQPEPYISKDGPSDATGNPMRYFLTPTISDLKKKIQSHARIKTDRWGARLDIRQQQLQHLTSHHFLAEHLENWTCITTINGAKKKVQPHLLRLVEILEKDQRRCRSIL